MSVVRASARLVNGFLQLVHAPLHLGRVRMDVPRINPDSDHSHGNSETICTHVPLRRAKTPPYFGTSGAQERRRPVHALAGGNKGAALPRPPRIMVRRPRLDLCTTQLLRSRPRTRMVLLGVLHDDAVRSAPRVGAVINGVTLCSTGRALVRQPSRKGRPLSVGRIPRCSRPT